MVREFVMPSMHRNPRQHRTSSRHRSHDDKNATHDHAGRERAMSEETVIADRQAEAGEQPHRKKQADLDGADAAIKQQAQRDERPEKGQYVEDNEVTPLQLMKVTALEYPIVAHFETTVDSRGKRYHSIVACRNPGLLNPGLLNPSLPNPSLPNPVFHAPSLLSKS